MKAFRAVGTACGGILLALLLASAGHAAGITATMRAQDPRLEKRVTLLTPRIYVGEMLDDLSRQSGVALAANERDGAADQPIAVFLRDVPLAEVMDALYSLMSYRRAPWHWNRTGDTGAFQYELLQPRAARLLPALLRQEIQAEFEAQDAELQKALKMSPEQLKEAAKNNPDIRLLASHDEQRGGLRRKGLNAFFETLSPDQRLRVLRGQEKIKVPATQLSEEGRSFILGLVKQEQDGAPSPTYVTFYAGYTGSLTPTLRIEPEGAGSYGYIGSKISEDAWHKKITDLWMLDSDTANTPASARNIPAPKKPKPEQETKDPLERRIEQAAEAVPLSLLARLPGPQPGLQISGAPVLDEPPYNQSVQAFLDRLKEAPFSVQHKWRGSVLLLSQPVSFVQEMDGTGVPWSLVKRLRASEEKAPDGFLSLQDLAFAARVASAGQLQRLGDEEFPVMRSVARWRELLAHLDRLPRLGERLRSPGGAPLAEMLPDLRSNPMIPLEKWLADNPTAARLVVEQEEHQAPPGAPKEKGVLVRNVHLDLLTRENKLVGRVGFFYQARQSETERAQRKAGGAN